MEILDFDRLPSPDGPYVRWLNETEVGVVWVEAVAGEFHLMEKTQPATQPLSCWPTHSRAFAFLLRRSHAVPPIAYPAPEKLLCLSDIEGNFEALRAILQGNAVIDAAYRWSFGKNQLLLLGDLMDREADVLPVLWLLYQLEAEAAAAGGRVHVLLGNHELMNLLGDYRYLHPKYQALARQLAKQPAAWEQAYGALFNETAELRSWLGSKNSVINIGDTLFVHAGLSRSMLHYSLEEINAGIKALIQENTPLKAYQSPFYGRQGPLWYRGFGRFGYSEPVSEIQKLQEVAEVLRHFAADRMIIGHNLTPEIRSEFGGKLISIDVPQEKGNYQALLIEAGHYFRVDDKGRKTVIQFSE